MACWTYLSFVSSIITYIEVGLHTTTDSELKKGFQDGHNLATSHTKELSEFMTQEGVALPETPQTKPKSNPEDIPLGAKLTDSNLLTQ